MSVTMVTIETPAGTGSAASFGVSELTLALAARGYRVSTRPPEWRIVVARGLDGPPESFTIERRGVNSIAVTGSDENGVMYGCLDLAEQVEMGRLLTEIVERRATPELRVRGLYRFLHNEESERDWVNDAAFWQSYADELARCRFNRFNLIYGHQSAYLIPIYAFMLDDLDAEFPEIKVRDITRQERRRNLNALQMASSAMESRGLTFFLGIWNSRPWKIENGVWETQPTRVTGTDDLGLLVEYTRRGFTRLMEVCPAIRGIQLRMNIESGIADQRFFVQAYVPALKELAQRGRRMVIELRNWGLHPDTIEAFRSTGLNIVVSTKYFAEHQGMPYQPPLMRGSYSYDSFLHKDKPFPFQWHVWNLGSHRLFAWGDPDHARRFATSCHLGDGIGFEVTPPGSQKGYSQWGEVYPGDWQPRLDLRSRWDFQRYWFFHWAFGRMGYDPSTGDDVFLHQLAKRTDQEAAPILLAAYRAASQVISYLISQRMDDPNMYVWPELDAAGPIDHNTIAPPGEVTLFATAREYAQAMVAGRTGAKRSPFAAADDLEGFANAIEAELSKLANLPRLKHKQEYQLIKVDFAALAALARYHAAKSRATGNLALFYASGERRYLDLAEAQAQEGLKLWDELCLRTRVYYPKLHFGPTGGHWRDNRPRVEYDLRRIRRVRELFDRYGLFALGFDFGPGPMRRNQGRFNSGLEPEPCFIGVTETDEYTSDKGFGWLQAAGLRSHGFADFSNQLLWGVHWIRPGVEYDPATVEAMPLDGLTQRYVTCDTPRTFRVDLPDGTYQVTVVAPAALGAVTPANVAGTAVRIGRLTATTAQINVTVSGGHLDMTIGGKGSWALAGLIIRPRLPRIAHLPPIGIPANQDVILTATATAPDGIASMAVHYTALDGEQEAPMSGDGTAFALTLPATVLTGDALDYQIIARDKAGHLTQAGPFHVPIVRDFHAPRIVVAEGPSTWSRRDEKLVFRLMLENGVFARDVILHYREADQNRDFRQARLGAGRSGEFVFEVETLPLDDNYELIYYFEVTDVLGGGSFYPDPFSEARYHISKPL